MPYSARYDYVHPRNGNRYRGVIEAKDAAELKRLVQDELDASEGALTPEALRDVTGARVADLALTPKQLPPDALTLAVRLVEACAALGPEWTEFAATASRARDIGEAIAAKRR
jgi:hypothetical protein